MAPLAPMRGIVSLAKMADSMRPRADTARHVEEGETHVPHLVFDVAAKDPEKEHVTGEVEHAEVQKGGEQEVAQLTDLTRPQAGRLQAVFARAPAQGMRRHENCNIDRDQRDGN